MEPKSALACGAAGIELVKEALWKDSPTMAVVADVNAVPPTGIGGIKRPITAKSATESWLLALLESAAENEDTSSFGRQAF